MDTQFVWKDEYNIGVEMIDKEHQRLFKIINKLFVFREEEKDSQWTCQEGIKYFRSHAMKHFMDEEAYMLSIGYEGLEQHRLIHKGFRENTLPALEQELADQRAALAHQRQELDQRQAELDKAEETIGLLSQYTLVSPEGEPPDYAALYPDFYAPDWEGETVSGGKRCYLTFDDGPSPNTDRILEVLDRYGAKATFFVVGYEARTAAGQERMRRIVAEGHALAMHSWSHDYKKVYASVEGFLEDFYRLYQYIHEVTGEYPALFRFPGGSINGYDRGVYQEIIAEMTRRGFVYFDWNASAQDATVYPRPAWDISADCLKGIGRELVVVLAHDSGARGTTVDALPAVIEGYRNAGYTLEALHPGVEPVHMGYPKIR